MNMETHGGAASPSSRSPEEEVFTQDDIPISLPFKWRLYMSNDAWKEFRATFVGAQVPQQSVSNEKLKESGHVSWKSAVLDGCAGFWY